MTEPEINIIELMQLMPKKPKEKLPRFEELQELGLNTQGYEILATYGSTYEFENNPAFEGVPIGFDTNDYGIPTKPHYPFGISLEPYPISMPNGFHGLFFPECYNNPEESFGTFLERIANSSENTVACILNQSGRINGQHITCHCQGGGFKHIHIIGLPNEEPDIDKLINNVKDFMESDFRLYNPETFSSLAQQNIENIGELFVHTAQYCFATISQGVIRGIKFLPTEPIKRTSGLTRQAVANYFGVQGDHRVIMNQAAIDPREHQRKLIQNWQTLHEVLQSS